MRLFFFGIALLLFTTTVLPAGAAEDAANIGQLEQKAFQMAVAAAADVVVQIHTVGGVEQIDGTQLAPGPTTGVVISPDGYIVSSTLGFIQQPSSILVRLPDGRQVPAKLIARDKSRMLVLLKVEVEEPLQIAKAAPTGKMEVGQWAIAVGRTFNAERVGVSVGVVSAVRRMYGRAIQTDANISSANYGGALIDLRGHVLGILVPMSPQSDSELASAKFYDSGIGFAVPLEHVLATLERWKQGDDLLRGKLGVGLRPGNVHALPPTITTIWPGSPAATADWKPQDVIVAVEGQEVKSVSQLRFEMVPRYAGDSVRVTVLRGEQRLESQLTLAGELRPFRHAFLGVLPVRVAAKTQAGVGVRSVWPESPAAVAGVRPGDRIVKIAAKKVASIEEAVESLNGKRPKENLELTVVRDEKEVVLKATLGILPVDVLTAADLPTPQPNGVLLEQDELKPLKLPEFSQTANYFLPSVEEEQLHGLLLWLTEGDAEEDLLVAQQWQEVCQRNGMILLIAHPKAETGWAQSDIEYLEKLVRAARGRWSLDSRRLAIGGESKAGQIAYALAFQSRNGFRGVVSIDGPLPRTLKIPEVAPNRELSILAVESRDSPLGILLRSDLQSLRKKGYPAAWLEQSTPGSQAIGPKTISAIGRWLDGLDRF